MRKYKILGLMIKCIFWGLFTIAAITEFNFEALATSLAYHLFGFVAILDMY